MELELGLAPPNSDLMIEELLDLNSSSSKSNADYHQRLHHASLDHLHALPLLLWSGQPRDDHHSNVRPRKWRKLPQKSNNDDEESQEIEGWPPINSSRKELMINEDGHGHGNHEALAGGRNSCMYVKVKMEGVAIGRKIDLKLYHSYPSLTTALINMFAKYCETKADYRILYKDKEGDWMLLGDVPWEMFVESVQRMEILRSSK